MSNLPKRIPESMLVGYGYRKTTEKLAKHVHFNSFRHHCDYCGAWHIQIQNGLCDECSKLIDNVATYAGLGRCGTVVV